MKKLRMKLAIIAIALSTGMGVQQVVSANDGANNTRGGCSSICGLIPGTRCTPSGCQWHL